MNFVGHAVVAWRERADPAFAFGAMVPDLSRFARREPPSPDRDVTTMRDGVGAHHRADAAFHDHPMFKRWMAELVDAMPVADRGARAAAHVAVELLIDGALLAAGEAGAYDDALTWALPTFDGTWSEVVTRMRTGAIVDAYASPTGIAERVVGVMRRRPRLVRIAPEPGDLAVAVAAVEASVVCDLSQLLDEVSERSLR